MIDRQYRAQLEEKRRILKFWGRNKIRRSINCIWYHWPYHPDIFKDEVSKRHRKVLEYILHSCYLLKRGRVCEAQPKDTLLNLRPFRSKQFLNLLGSALSFYWEDEDWQRVSHTNQPRCNWKWKMNKQTTLSNSDRAFNKDLRWQTHLKNSRIHQSASL